MILKFLLNLFLSTVENVGKIIVLDQGRIVEEGSHKQLIKNMDIIASYIIHTILV